MWPMRVSEKLHAVGGHPLLILAVLSETLVCLLAVAGSPVLLVKRTSKVLPVTFQENHMDS